MIKQIIASSKVMITLGTGGVGKTTTAAAIAYLAAKDGRSVCVVTIDPAKRLADAMGISEIDNTPKRIETSPGIELWAVMLDAHSTFDELVQKFASSDEQVEKIFSNPVYRNLTENLSGTQEYMAMEKLHELASDPRFDLLVVDTPPARNAIEFLNAPKRLIGFLENRVFQLLISPNHALLKPITIASRLLLRTISKVVGNQVVSDAIEFFQAFQGMEKGFKERAAEIQNLLELPSTSFVLVTGTHQDTIDEALYFSSKLDEFNLSVNLIISNRITPNFALKENPSKDMPEALVDNLEYLAKLRSAEITQISRLSHLVHSDNHILVPQLTHDVGSLAAMDELGRAIIDENSTYSTLFPG